MELNALDQVFLVADGHDFFFVVRSPGRHCETVRQRARLDDQRMIASSGEWIVEPIKDALPVVANFGGLTVHEALRPNDLSPEGITDALVPEADPKERNLACEVFDNIV